MKESIEKKCGNCQNYIETENSFVRQSGFCELGVSYDLDERHERCYPEKKCPEPDWFEQL